MPDDRPSTNDDAILAVGGVLFVGATSSGRSRVQVGPAAGWMVPRGIAQWERELSFVARAGLTPGLVSVLRATRADEQIAPKRFPTAKKAVEVSPLLALASNLVDDVRAQGVRVHTVGVDRVSGDFYYFEEGGGRDPVRVQGNLVEMLAPSIGASSTNDEIAARMEDLIDRLLRSLSDGAVSELAVELADALPRLARDGTGLEGTDLVTFELQAAAFAKRAARWEAAARRIPPALEEAARKGLTSTAVPLFGEARQEAPSPLEVLIDGTTRTLPGPAVWTVTGIPREEPKVAASPAPAIASPAAARTSPSPDSPSSPPSAKPPPSPIPSRPSPVPAPSLAASGPDAPPPMPRRINTPIPPRPEPTAHPASPAAAESPARKAAEAPPPAQASAPTPAPAREPASEARPAPARDPAPTPSASSTATTGRPAPRPAEGKSSSATLILAIVALAALAYVAFERLLH